MGVRTERGPSVATLVIDRPEKHNALDGEVLEGLVMGLRELDADETVRVIVLTGAGDRSFCSGADLAGGLGGDGAIARYDALGGMRELLGAVDGLGKPLVGRINGHALAGGFGLALACDLLVAADHATFGTPEVRRGLWPFLISTLITDHLPPKRALDLMMTGRRIGADEAAAWGLVNRVAPAGELDDAVAALTDELVRGSPVALRLGRRASVTARDQSRAAALAYLHGMLDLSVQTADVVEGMTAFFEKRDPDWPGR